MAEQTGASLTQADMLRLIERDVQKSRSIYAPSGAADPLLDGLYRTISTEERMVRLASSERLTIEVTLLLDLAPLAEATPELREGMLHVLLHDGHRRLVSGRITVDSAGYHAGPDRLVYTCAKSYRSKVAKLVRAWNENRAARR